MYYRIDIVSTSKDPGSKENFQVFNNEHITYKTLDEVKADLKDRYSRVKFKRNKMYVDKNGEAEHIGYVYRFRNADISHNSPEWIQEDWVKVVCVEEKPVMEAWKK